jgi:hypothetical protein
LEYLADCLGLNPTEKATNECSAFLRRLRIRHPTEYLDKLGPDFPVKIPPHQRHTMALQIRDGRTQLSSVTSPLPRGREHIDDDRFEEFLERYGDAKRVFLVEYGKSGTT